MPAAKDAISNVPGDEHPETVMIAVLAAPCAMAFDAQLPAAVPPSVTFAAVAFTVTFSELQAPE